ncbi:MAG: DUF3726 domain-containing protein [Candidatus Pelagibacterales bacterium]|nr:MAG: DUF3726 domain-containing protein [Pelagibacterales bacterium]
MKSLSEVDTTSKRASRAAGYSWGISEEIGKAIRSLELFGLPGIENLNLYLKKIKKNHPKKIIKIDKENKSNELCPIYCGVAFLDQCNLLEKLKIIKFNNVNYPLLILPFISKCSEILGKRILIQFNNTSFLVSFNKSILSKNIDTKICDLASEIRIEFLENKNSFSEQDWNELYKLSEETFVEETESLRSKGAGAGLTDND